MSLHLAYRLLDDKIGHDFCMSAGDGLEAEVVVVAVGSRLRGHRAPGAPPGATSRPSPRRSRVWNWNAEKSHAAVADDAKDVAKMTDFEHI